MEGLGTGKGRRTEIDVLLEETRQDLLFVSEANLFVTTPAWKRHLDGYRMLLPPTIGEGWLFKDGLAS